MRYNEYYGSAYNFEVGYLEGLRSVSLMLAQTKSLEDALIHISEMLAEQVKSVQDEIPNEE